MRYTRYKVLLGLRKKAGDNGVPPDRGEVSHRGPLPVNNGNDRGVSPVSTNPKGDTTKPKPKAWRDAPAFGYVLSGQGRQQPAKDPYSVVGHSTNRYGKDDYLLQNGEVVDLATAVAIQREQARANNEFLAQMQAHQSQIPVEEWGTFYGIPYPKNRQAWKESGITAGQALARASIGPLATIPDYGTDAEKGLATVVEYGARALGADNVANFAHEFNDSVTPYQVRPYLYNKLESAGLFNRLPNSYRHIIDFSTLPAEMLIDYASGKKFKGLVDNYGAVWRADYAKKFGLEPNDPRVFNAFSVVAPKIERQLHGLLQNALRARGFIGPLSAISDSPQFVLDELKYSEDLHNKIFEQSEESIKGLLAQRNRNYNPNTSNSIYTDDEKAAITDAIKTDSAQVISAGEDPTTFDPTKGDNYKRVMRDIHLDHLVRRPDVQQSGNIDPIIFDLMDHMDQLYPLDDSYKEPNRFALATYYLNHNFGVSVPEVLVLCTKKDPDNVLQYIVDEYDYLTGYGVQDAFNKAWSMGLRQKESKLQLDPDNFDKLIQPVTWDSIRNIKQRK